MGDYGDFTFIGHRFCVNRKNSKRRQQTTFQGLLKADFPQVTLLFPPIGHHLHPQLHPHINAQKLAQLRLGIFAYPLQPRTLPTDYDHLLTLPVHPNLGLNHHLIRIFMEALDDHGSAVGDFLLIKVKDGFTYHFGGKEAHGQVRELILLIVGVMEGDISQDALHQNIHIFTRGAAHKVAFLYPGRQLCEQRLPIHIRLEVYLVEHRYLMRRAFGEQLQDLVIIIGGKVCHICDKEHQIDVFEAVVHDVQHPALHLVAWFEKAGCVYEDDLRILTIQDAFDGVASGLRLGRSDGELFAQDAVEEGGFPRIWLADDRYPAAAKGCICHLIPMAKVHVTTMNPAFPPDSLLWVTRFIVYSSANTLLMMSMHSSSCSLVITRGGARRMM